MSSRPFSKRKYLKPKLARFERDELGEPVTNPKNNTETTSSRWKPSIDSKVMEYLATRDHSEKELRTKLKKNYEEAEIDQAIQDALDRKWLKHPEELSASVTEMLHRRNKGHLHIQAYLKKLGLPGSKKDPERELSKAKSLAEGLSDRSLDTSTKDLKRDRSHQQKIYRFLAYRGYDDETIRKVIYEKF